MRIPCKAREILRWALFAITAALPSLFQNELFAYWTLPFFALFGLAFAEITHFKRLRFFPALLSLAVVLALASAFARVIAGALGDTAYTAWYARVSLTAYPIFLVSIAAFASSRLYRASSAWKALEPLALLALFGLGFWSQGNYHLTVFNHPLKAALFALIVCIVAFSSMLFSDGRMRRMTAALTALLPVLLLSGFLVIGHFSVGSVTANGGLIQPTLFRFDFSPFLSLQSDISLNDRLVLIAHVPEEYSSSLLRRMSLSGWDPAKGFYEQSAPGESAQITAVPPETLALSDPGYALRNTVRQEFFIVNFDPKSLIAMDYPIRIEPFKIWKTDSFNGAYAVTSRATGYMPFELYDSPPPDPSNAGDNSKQLSAEDLAFYTRIDPETDSFVRPIATALSGGVSGYYDRVMALNLWLLGNSFRYSLHPGTAPDGNQLRYFLTESRKGYCTYYAFSLALLCRSLGIPARVAAGFFMAPDSGALDYYPIRSNMAHAWVEVFFPEYGWIAFDPTNQNPAEGEALPFDFSPRGDEFLGLLNEIIERKNELTLAADDSETATAPRNPLRMLADFLSKEKRYAFLLLALLPLYPLFREAKERFLLRTTKNARLAILLAEGQSRKALKRTIPSPEILSLREELTRLANKARFARGMDQEEADAARSLLRRIRASLRADRKKGRKGKKAGIILFFALLLGAIGSDNPLHAQEIPSEAGADAVATLLLERANRAISAENWETATALLLEGKQRFPANPSFPYTLGSLFLEQSLYPAAIRELEKALDLGYANPEIYLKLSDATGYENQDEDSLLWLRRYVTEEPDNLSAWASFGWLCYKTHRFEEGIETLNRITETWGADGNVLVGLGNLYSAVYDYENAKARYSQAIDLANEKNQQYLASVYYYNRSILEESFYRFDDAYHDAELSLEAAPRASGFLMQAELEQRKLEYGNAIEKYAKAQSLDTTPLATLGLAETLLQAGYPERAYAQLQSITAKTDRSWIANYGTTTQQFSSDLYRLERDYWRIRKNQEKRKVMHSFSTEMKRLFSLALFSFREWLFDAKFRISTLAISRSYTVPKEGDSGRGLYYHSFKYVALDRWPELAKPHLQAAQSIETLHIPMAQPSYYYEWGALYNDVAALDNAIRTLDPLWERKILSEALSKRLQTLARRDLARRADVSDRLYQLDPSRFLFDDRNLQVRIFIDPSIKRNVEKRISSALSSAGFQDNPLSELQVAIRATPEGIKISLEKDNGIITESPQIIHNLKLSPPVISQFVNNFSTIVFQSNLGA